MDRTKLRAILIRFLKGGVAGAISMVSVISLANISTWTELQTALVSLSLAAIVGFITGVIMAAEKWATWTEPTI